MAGAQGITRRTFMRASALVACGIAAAPLLESCSSSNDGDEQGKTQVESHPEWLEADPLTDTLFYFDTVITLTVYCDEDLLQKVEDRCQYFENTLSRTIEGTDVWRINEAQGRTVEVAEETADVISKALAYCEETDGLFDITIGAASSLWDFDEGIKPDDDELAEAVKHIDYTKVSVDTENLTVTLADPEAKIDLGGIAKGYIADDLARILREGGCESACINLGGNVYVLGTKPDGSDWQVGIQDPNGATSVSVIASLPAHDQSIVTSGLYERQFTQDGVTYYHILDPKTGYPAETDLIASSVVCENSLDGDAYSTTMFLLGHDGALAFIEAHDGFEGLVVDEDSNITVSSGSNFTLR